MRRFRQKYTHVSATGEAPESSSRDREDVRRPDLTEDGGAAPPVSRTEKEEIGAAEINSALEVNCGLIRDACGLHKKQDNTEVLHASYAKAQLRFWS